MSKKATRELLEALSAALCARGLARDAKDAAERLRASGAAEALGELPKARIRCAEIAERCAPLLGDAPARGDRKSVV